MPPVEIVPGLLRWTAPHPEWNPQAAPGSAEDWDQEVGWCSMSCPMAVALIDPLLPSEGRTRVPALARRADREPSGQHSHDDPLAPARPRGARRALQVDHVKGVERGSPGVQPRAAARSRGDDVLAAGCRSARPRRSADRRARRAPALCPESWLDEVHVNRPGLAELLRPLVELPIERVLVSHGEPVLRDGRAALVQGDRRRRGRLTPGFHGGSPSDQAALPPESTRHGLAPITARPAEDRVCSTFVRSAASAPGRRSSGGTA